MAAFLSRRSREAQAEPEPVEATLSERVLGHLTERGFVPFHPVLAERFGHRAALFIGVCLYWTKYGLKHAPQRGGWFHMSAKDMTAATTLSRHEQDTVRALLEDRGILEQRLAGRPAVLHYRLDLRSLATALDVVENGEPAPTLDQAWTWFQGTITFYRPLADIGGNAAAGLYLSYLLRQLQQSLTRDGIHGELLQVEPARVARSLCLTPKVVRTARERLKRSGLLSDVGQFQRVNLGAILACLQQQSVKPLPRTGQHMRGGTDLVVSAAKPGRGSAQAAERASLPANLAGGLARHSSGGRFLATFLLGTAGTEVAANRQLGVPRRDGIRGGTTTKSLANDARHGAARSATSQDAQSGKLADRAARTGKLALPNPATHINTGYSIEQQPRAHEIAAMTVSDARRRRDEQRQTPAKAPEKSAPAPSEADLDGLEYPEALTRLHRQGVKHILRGVAADLRQPLLDELAGHLSLPGKTISNPAGWLHRVAIAASEGAPLPLAASTAQVRAARRMAAEREAMAMRVGPPPVQRPRSTPVQHSAIRDEQIAKARALAAETRSLVAKARFGSNR